MTTFQPERTGLVKVTMVDGRVLLIEADSFGAAAAKVHSGEGSIQRFEWAPRD